MNTTMEKFYYWYDRSKIGTKPEIDSWFLMESPVAITSICVGYILYVLIIGPLSMKNRKPYEIKNIILLYNFMQVIYNLWILQMFFREKHFPKQLATFGCAEIPAEDRKTYFDSADFGLWVYMLNKVLDLLDTVFFVLRKKQSHVTILHVYHHVGTLSIAWFLLKYFPGQEAAVVGLLNVFIHAVMYIYYSLAALGPAVQKYLWWKKYITVMQITQFIVLLVYFGLCYFFSCYYNRKLLVLFMIHAIINLTLFLNFYYHAYIKTRSRSQDKVVEAKKTN